MIFTGKINKKISRNNLYGADRLKWNMTLILNHLPDIFNYKLITTLINLLLLGMIIAYKDLRLFSLDLFT